MPGGRLRPVFWTEEAGKDLDEILAHIALDRPLASQSVGENLLRQARTLESHPERGRVVPELADLGMTTLRELVVAPWRIVYHVDPGSVQVLYVIDSRRRVADVILRRFFKRP